MTTFRYKLLKFGISRLLININVPNLKRKLKSGNKSKINYSIQIVFDLRLFDLSPDFQERILDL
jgi:LEA14-like dessication related protein